MDGEINPLSDLLIVLLLVLTNAIFVAAEFALVRTNPLHFRNPDSRKKPGTRPSLVLLDDMDLSLSAIQLGITIASVSLGWWGQRTLFGMINSLANYLGEPLDPVFSRPVAIAFALAAVIYLHVVLGELAAKSIAIKFPEASLRFLAGFIVIFTQLCRPIIYLTNSSANLVLNVFGIRRSGAEGKIYSLAELSFLVSRSTEGGMLDKEEQEMLRGVFGLSDTVAREIMTPRTDLVTIESDAKLDDVLSIIRDSGLSRFPIIGQGVDDVIGILLARDVLNFVVPGMVKLNSRSDEFEVRKIMREPYFIPGTKPIDDLLTEFKRRKLHLAIVLDEHGGVDGVVTLEDLLEEIVGDIFDESDVPEKSIVEQENGDLLIDGGQLVADINARFGLEIPEGDYDTIAGFIFTSLGRMPRPGDSIVVSVQPPINQDAEEEIVPEEVDSPESSLEEKEIEAQGAEPHAKALITVEKVQSYRIESVRLHKCEGEEEVPASAVDRTHMSSERAAAKRAA